jgi:hypothetical protein
VFDLETLTLAACGFLGCVGAIMVYFAALVDSWKKETKNALLIVVSYTLFELVSLYVLPMVFRNITLNVSTELVKILAIFVIAPVLVVLFLAVSITFGKESSKNTKVYDERYEKYAANCNIQLNSLSKNIVGSLNARCEEIERQAEARAQQLWKESTLEQAALNTEILNELDELKDDVNEMLSEFQRATPTGKSAQQPTAQIKVIDRNGAQDEGTLIDPDVVYGEVARMIPQATRKLQENEVSEEVMKMLPSEIIDHAFQPLDNKILHAIRRILLKNQKTTMTAISLEAKINKSEIKVFLQDLKNRNLVDARLEGKAVVYFLSENPFVKNTFQPILFNQREGGEIAFLIMQEILTRCGKENCFVWKVDQVAGTEQPDLIVVPPLTPKGREGWDFSHAKALEIETPSEVRAHPDQVQYNPVKDMLLGFKEVEIWCTTESTDKVEDLFVVLPRPICMQISIREVGIGSEEKVPTH